MTNTILGFFTNYTLAGFADCAGPVSVDDPKAKGSQLLLSQLQEI